MLNLVFFDYPFIHIDRFCITLSSFFIMLFFLLSNGAHWYFWEKSIPKRAYLYFGAKQKLYGSQSYFCCLASTCFAFSYTGFKHLQATPKIQSV